MINYSAILSTMKLSSTKKSVLLGHLVLSEVCWLHCAILSKKISLCNANSNDYLLKNLGMQNNHFRDLLDFSVFFRFLELLENLSRICDAGIGGIFTWS